VEVIYLYGVVVVVVVVASLNLATPIRTVDNSAVFELDFKRTTS
jgi:hypothetical protein